MFYFPDLFYYHPLNKKATGTYLLHNLMVCAMDLIVDKLNAPEHC